MLRIPTIWVAVLQGMAGTMPWMILGLYFITWLVNERGLDESGATVAFAGIVGAAFFTLFYWTYPRDREKLRAEMAARAEEIG